MDDRLSVPEFIPDEVASPHLDEARRRIASSVGASPERRDRSAPVAPGRVGLIAAATALGVLGLLGLSVLWTWLAITSDAALWIPFAVGGWIATVAVPGVVVGWWWDRSGDETTPWFHPRGDVRWDVPWQGGG